MQEDVEHRSISLVIKAAKLTGDLLKKAIRKLLAELEKGVSQNPKRVKAPVIPHGKQTVKQLVGQNQGVSNLEITDKNIKPFESIARKYGVDYAVKKVKPGIGETVPTYHVFFKARDSDALTTALKEYTAKKVRKAQRPSVRAALRKMKSVSKDKPVDRARNKAKEVAR